MSDCIFCKIANGEIPTTTVYENDLVRAFRDTDPQAPTHVLVVPKRHIQSVNQLTQEDGELMLAMLDAIHNVVKSEGIEAGYRLVANTGEQGGQSVPHLTAVRRSRARRTRYEMASRLIVCFRGIHHQGAACALEARLPANPGRGGALAALFPHFPR